MSDKEFKENIIAFIYMSKEELNSLDGEYLELWNKFSIESKQLLKNNAIMRDILFDSKILIEDINDKTFLCDLWEDDETGNLYNEDGEIVFSMDDYWNTNAENMALYIYDYELKRGIKL